MVTVNARYALGRLHNPGNDTTTAKPGKRSGAPAERECSAGYSVISLQRSGCREAKDKLTMRSICRKSHCWSSDPNSTQRSIDQARTAEERLGITIQPIEAHQPGHIERAFSSIQDDVTGVVVAYFSERESDSLS